MVSKRHFASDQEEAEFWETHDSTEFLDHTKPVPMEFVDARPRKTPISLRLDPDTIEKVKRIARRKGVGYQTLMRMWIMEHLNHEIG